MGLAERVRPLATDLSTRARRAAEGALALAAQGLRVAWLRGRSLRLPSIQLVRAMTAVLQERYARGSRTNTPTVVVTGPAQPRQPGSADDGLPELRRKRSAATSETISQLLQYQKQHEVGVLKATLENAPPPSRPRTIDRGLHQAVAASRGELSATPPATCRIVLWRGYLKCEFHAKVRTQEGGELTERISPSFHWGRAAPPPPEVPEVARAYGALVDELAAAGWMRTGGGDDWYSLEFERPELLPAAGERRLMSTDLEKERLISLAERLAAATAHGAARWQVTANDAYSWRASEGTVTIASRDRDGEPPYELAIYNAGGEKVDELTSEVLDGDEPSPWNEALAEVHRVARRSALGADDVIDALLERLSVARSGDAAASLEPPLGRSRAGAASSE